ncbi:hypothetical protein C8F01DRAFT_1106134 [Mycena amicta]|nr:hypothetical protein C8F01DRAFT_1106134 [Mycena amicta]
MVNSRLLVKSPKNRKQSRKTVSVRYYHTFGPPVQISAPVLRHPVPTLHSDFIAIDTLLAGYHIQPRVHEIFDGVQHRDDDGHYHTDHYRAFYKNHKGLPRNLFLNIQGDLAIVRMSEGQPVNLRRSDRRIADYIAVSLKAAIGQVQQRRAPKKALIKILSMPNHYTSAWS